MHQSPLLGERVAKIKDFGRVWGTFSPTSVSFHWWRSGRKPQGEAFGCVSCKLTDKSEFDNFFAICAECVIM